MPIIFPAYFSPSERIGRRNSDEWASVAIRSHDLVGFEEGLLPHQSSIDEENIEEERRLAYVGITRARRHLTISYTSRRKRYGEDLICEPSRFLNELPREHLLYDDDVPQEVKKETGQANLENLRAILNQG